MPTLAKTSDYINYVRALIDLEPLESCMDTARIPGPKGRKLTFKQLSLLVCLYARRVTCKTQWATTSEISQVTGIFNYNGTARTLVSLERRRLVEHRDPRELNGSPLQWRLTGDSVTFVAALLTD